MESLLSLLKEASITPDIIEKMIRQGTRVSVYYRGDDKVKKGWRQVSVLKSEKRKNKEGKEEDYMIVKDWGSANEEEIALLQTDVTNWNVLSSVKIDLDNEIIDAIKNKRGVVIKYKGAKESSVGERLHVYPVAYGTKNGRKYIRAWQEKGKTTTEIPNWKFFRLDRVSGWSVDTTAPIMTSEPGPNYKNDGDDEGMTKVIAYAKFSEQKMMEALLEAVRIL